MRTAYQTSAGRASEASYYTPAMPGGSVSRIAIAPRSAVTDTEEGRAFFQDRLRLYAGWVFALSGGFYVLTAILSRAFVTRSLAAHLGASLTMGTVWFLCRTGARRMRLLRSLDAVGLIVTCLLFAVMGREIGLAYAAAGVDPFAPLLIGQLACSSTLLSRAVALPSTPRRTFWLSVAALAPQPLLAAATLLNAPVVVFNPGVPFTPAQAAIAETLHIAAWCAVTAAISTVGTSVIFGLRAEASKVKRLGQYVLEEKLGEGGMGVVYRASHAMLRRPTAIKLLPPEKAGAENIARFEREVQITARLSHPSTVAIFDYGRTPTGVFYYAMEYLDGLNLQQLVQHGGPQPPARVIHILAQVTGALVEAHEAGLVHRDIKPENIILCERGGMPDVAKVVDFGLVRHAALGADEAATLQTSRSVLTGTPLYMAPETVKGEPFIDGRSDLYALGAVGYFLLTGRPPFEASTVVEIIAHHLHTTPEPPSARSPHSVPRDLEALILRCLAKEPEDRHPSARALGHALRECAAATPWSQDDATAWWQTFRRQSGGGRAPAASDTAPTLAVDLDDRVAPQGSRA